MLYSICPSHVFKEFSLLFGISISSLAVFRPPTIPQHQHQEVAAPVQQSKEEETHEKELELVLCTKSCCVRDILHLECSVGSYRRAEACWVSTFGGRYNRGTSSWGAIQMWYSICPAHMFSEVSFLSCCSFLTYLSLHFQFPSPNNPTIIRIRRVMHQ